MFKPNDIVQVIANTSGHSFKINQLIRLSEIADDEFDIPYWKAFSFDGDEYSWIPERDVKYYTVTIDPINLVNVMSGSYR